MQPYHYVPGIQRLDDIHIAGEKFMKPEFEGFEHCVRICRAVQLGRTDDLRTIYNDADERISTTLPKQLTFMQEDATTKRESRFLRVWLVLWTTLRVAEVESTLPGFGSLASESPVECLWARLICLEDEMDTALPGTWVSLLLSLYPFANLLGLSNEGIAIPELGIDVQILLRYDEPKILYKSITDGFFGRVLEGYSVLDAIVSGKRERDELFQEVGKRLDPMKWCRTCSFTNPGPSYLEEAVSRLEVTHAQLPDSSLMLGLTLEEAKEGLIPDA
ncbi:hypothetical protein B0T14DRAFT_511749 [Immersiella caudata]|uniref:Uncharacterized protein n=1 Tax=Immersiella caudata TaxID=314043 RepID=A0AA39X4P2_9PEZI|nr:hypothetical protein B0T14DRAFT_511749 [Immersiella caudata]